MRKILRYFIIQVILLNLSTLSAAQSGFNASVTASHVTCSGQHDGSADLTVSGGVAPYTYIWSNGETSEDISGLAGGLYSVIVTDAEGNTTTACIQITEPSPIKASIAFPELICDDKLAQASVSATGGTGPYVYKWDDNSLESERIGLTAGSYSVTITDALGCSVTKGFEIKKGGDFALSVSATHIKCFGNYEGSATASVSGQGSYSFAWSNGGTESEINMLPAGNYKVVVSDANGCTKTDSVTITQPSDIQLEGNVSITGCNGGAIDASVSGGTVPYNYYWSNGNRNEDISGLANGTYILRVSDANSCLKSLPFTVAGVDMMKVVTSSSDVTCDRDNNGSVTATVSGGNAPYTYSWSNGLSGSSINGLASGSFTVNVTDANGCTKSATAIVEKEDPFQFQLEQKNITCHDANNGSIKLVSDNSADFSFEWSNGESGSEVHNLGEGNYNVIITSPEGCQKEMEFTISNPPAIKVSLNYWGNVCEGGKIDASISGGTAPFTYSWSNGATTEDIQNLNPGTYKIVVTDKNGCKDSAEAYIQGRSISKVNVVSTPITCFGKNDGTATAVVEGENGPYTYTWSSGEQAESISGLAKGVYTVTVTDYYGCQYYSSTTISEPSNINAAVFTTNPTCSDENNGVVRAVVQGGTSPYSYNWNTGSNALFVSGLSTGRYTVNITDKMGCTATATGTLVAPEKILISSITANSCNGGVADISVTGGKSPYYYQWSDQATIEDRINLTAGNYSVKVTDANGCTEVKEVIVPVYDAVIATATASGNSATASASGGTEPYSFNWSSGHNSPTASGLDEGEYTVTVTDATGCSSSATVSIIGNNTDALTASIDCCQDLEICKGEFARIPVHFSGTAPFTFSYKTGYKTYTVTTDLNPYYIEEQLFNTTTFELLSVSNGCSNGTVCGKATIGVNDCSGKCESVCFSAEVTDVFENGNCRQVSMTIKNDGTCKYGLSHLSVSVPCGTVKSVVNSRGFKIEKGIDPTSKIQGFKVDNISNFGEAKNGKNEIFFLEYTVCKEEGECFGDFCAPLLAFKASTCVYYVKPAYNPGGGPVITNNDSNKVNGDLKLYPNPAENASTLRAELPIGTKGKAEVILFDSKGNQILTMESNISESDSGLELNLPETRPGVYLVIIRTALGQYKQKLSIN